MFWRNVASSQALSEPDTARKRALQTLGDLDEDATEEEVLAILEARKKFGAFADVEQLFEPMIGGGAADSKTKAPAGGAVVAEGAPMIALGMTEEQKAAKRKELKEATAALIAALHKKRERQSAAQKEQARIKRLQALEASGKRWTPAMDETLKQEFEKYKELNECVDMITASLEHKTREQVMGRMRKLGLKRPKLPKPPKQKRERKARSGKRSKTGSDSDEEDEEDDESDVEWSGRPQFKKVLHFIYCLPRVRCLCFLYVTYR